ncbi:MAG: TonB-dependent receptor plug domain-containing protein, partial [Flexibacteraceae bacterium]
MFFLISMGGYAQQVKGTITDIETGEVLPFTNVVLKNIADSSFISGVVTYISGVYELKYKPEQVTGKAILEFTCMGYRKVVKGPFKKSDIPTILDIKLAKIVNEVGPVLITAQKPKMQVQAGKTTVDIAGSSMSQGLSAADVLQRMPGVTLDNDGNIGIKGKQGVMVMINDKPTYLSQEQVLALLRNTPSSNISEIEIISQPGAQFDASGTAGMINIKLKKPTRESRQG